MCRIFAGLTAAMFVLALGAPAFAKVDTIKGQLVDQGCYKMNKANTGLKHDMKNGPVEDCATACAKKGQPVALLTADGKVYQVTGDLAANNNAKLVPHMSHTVEVTGDVAENNGAMTIAGTALKMISK